MHFLSIGSVSISPWKMRNPDEDFIQRYDSVVPDISELVNYNIGLQEVLSRQGVIFWRCIAMPSSSKWDWG